MSNIGSNLLDTLKISAPEAAINVPTAKASGEPNADFAGILGVESLLANTDQMSLKEQGDFLTQLVTKLPKESLEGIKELVKENFENVLDTFPKLEQTLESGDIKGFVESLSEVLGEQDQKQLSDLQKSLLIGNNTKESKKSSLTAIPVKGEQGLAENTKNINSSSSENSTSSTEDFLSLRNFSKGKSAESKSESPIVPTQIKGQEKNQANLINNNLEFDKEVLKSKAPNMALYSKHADAFTDKLIKPAQAESILKPLSLDGKNSETSQTKSEILSPLTLLTPIESGAENQGQQLSQGEGNQDTVAGKVLNLSNISAKNSTQLISKISDYIQQNAIMNQTQIDLTVHHEELGQFKVNVQRVGAGNQLDIEILTATKEAQVFFAEHEVELIKKLSDSGIKLSGMKIAQATSGKISAFSENSSNLSDNNSQQGASSQERNQNLDRKQDQDNGQDRRKQLWNKYREQLNQAAA